MKKLFQFLASLYFALIVIFAIALYALLGTYLEASTKSHLFVQSHWYRSSFFMFILAALFTNILFSALKRWPFQKKHVPFLLTHLGLLLILTGVICKNFWGNEGVLTLQEGRGSHELIHRDELVIVRESVDGNRLQIPLKQGACCSSFTIDTLFPHHKKTTDTWIKDDRLDIDGLSAIPLYHRIKVRLGGQEWFLSALQVNSVEEVWKELYLKDLKQEFTDFDTLYFPKRIEDLAKDPPYLMKKTVKIPLNGPTALFNYSSGEILLNEQGQDVVHTPSIWFLKDKSRKSQVVLIMGPHGQLELWNYPESNLSHIVSYEGGKGGQFAECVLREKDFLSRKEKEDILLTNSIFLEELTNSLNWTILLLEDLHKRVENGATLKELVLETPWKFLLDPEEKEVPIESFFATILQIAPTLGTAPAASEEKKKNLLLYIFSKNMENPSWENMREVLETPLSHRYTPLLPLTLEEENRPLALVRIGNEKVPVPYDFSKVPILEENAYITIDFHKEEIPYHLRLHEARTKRLPHSKEAAGYEASITLTHRKSSQAEDVLLSMNQVFETQDGYRFYLTSITEPQRASKQAVITVNYDPFKYKLTYPGVMILMTGICLLFFFNPYKKKEKLQ